MTAVFLRSWGCRLLKGGVGWRGGAGIFRFPPKLTVGHFQMEVEDFNSEFLLFGLILGPFFLAEKEVRLLTKDPEKLQEIPARVERVVGNLKLP